MTAIAPSLITTFSQPQKLASKGFFDGGQRLVQARTTLKEHIGEELPKLTPLTSVKRFTVDIRKKRVTGFATEALKIAFGPALLLSRLNEEIIGSSHNMFKAILSCGILGGLAGAVTVLTAPLTFAVAIIFTTGRILHYAYTHTTIKIDNHKYFIESKAYKNLINIDGFSQKPLTAAQRETRLLEACTRSIEATLESAESLDNTLNKHLYEAFNAAHYQSVILLIKYGANPNLLLPKIDGSSHVDLKDGASFAFGSLFALTNVELTRNPDNQDLQELFRLLKQKLPVEQQTTYLLESEADVLSEAEKQAARLRAYLSPGPVAGYWPFATRQSILEARLEAASDEQRNQFFNEERYVSPSRLAIQYGNSHAFAPPLSDTTFELVTYRIGTLQAHAENCNRALTIAAQVEETPGLKKGFLKKVDYELVDLA